MALTPFRIKMKKYLTLGILLAVIFGAFLYLKSDYKNAPPTLYFNGNIITINDQQPTANAMLVVDGIIQSIGKRASIEHQNIKNLQKRDLKGATIMPGFIDVHTHFALSMFLSEMHDLSGFKHDNNEEVWRHFEKIAKNAKAEEWLIFKGLDPILVSDLEIPSLSYLDSITPNNPILIFSQSLHNYLVNTKAFEKASITNDTPNPSSHSFYERDSSGKLTGMIVEQEAVKPFVDILRDEVLTAKLMSRASENVMSDYAKNGNTTVVSTGLTINDKKPLILLQHLSDKNPTLLGGLLAKIGQFPARQPFPRHFIYMRHDMTNLLPKKRTNTNDFYDIIGIKHWYDGSPYIGTMYMDAPYLDTELTTQKLAIPKQSKGEALINEEALREFIKFYHAKGWQIAIHTQGDAAIKDVIKAYKNLEPELDFSKSRHRLEHCLMLPQSQINDLKALNLSPSFHVNHLYYYGDALYTDVLGEARTNKILPIHSTHKEGIKVTLHADQPMFESKPFRLIQTAVERKTDTGRIIAADESVSLLDAIKMLTIDAAWQIDMENKIGSLEKGKYADFIILDKNPFDVSIEKLDQIQCLETFVNGNKVEGKR